MLLHGRFERVATYCVRSPFPPFVCSRGPSPRPNGIEQNVEINNLKLRPRIYGGPATPYDRVDDGRENFFRKRMRDDAARKSGRRVLFVRPFEGPT